MLNTKTLLLAAGAVGMLAVAGSTTANSAYYDGKTITFIVGASPGGGLTRAARVYAKHMQQHVPGNPNIIIKNQPGAGGNKARNFVYGQAKPDGMTLHWGPLNQMGALLKLKGIRYNPSKFVMIGTGDTTYFNLIRADTGKGLKTAADIVNAGGITFGGRGPSSNLDIYGRASLKMLGLEHRYVPGYRGTAKLAPAMRSKEINMATSGNGGYHGFYKDTILKSGEAIALYYHSAMDSSGKASRFPGFFGDAMHFIDFHKKVTGKEPAGNMWEAYKWISKFSIYPFTLAAPPGTPAEAIADLRKGHADTPNDPEFKADYLKSVGPIPDFQTGQKVEWMATGYTEISPEALAGLKELTRSTQAAPRKKKK